MAGCGPGVEMSRVLIVANRLPVTASVAADGFALAPSTGGLATALGRVHRNRGGIWIGSPGLTTDQLAPPIWGRLVGALAEDGLVPIPMSQAESEKFYDGFSNSFIWPILHSLTGRVPLDTDAWESYREVNQRFADAVVARYQPGDLIWVHDFHLFLVPEMIRAAIPNAAIGFFLHVPFPTGDIFRTLPRRKELLHGILGASLIGFHTASYLRHFSVALAEILALTTDIDRVVIGDRAARLGVFPIGIDAAEFERTALDPFVERLAEEIRGGDGGRLLVAVDRLDYTKGVPRRLLGFEQLLERHPELREQVRLVNLSVPTRDAVPAYQEYRQQVEGLVGRINGRFSTPRWTPIHYMFRAIDRPNLVALYRAADVMLVTPIRDGMNLVAKEFVAARVDGDGVLVLSEFAGASADLPEAVPVNPYEVGDLAARMAEALAMPEVERRERMAALRIRVGRYDNDWWAETFLGTLAAEGAGQALRGDAPGNGALEAAMVRFTMARRRVFMLDYDGTLAPFADRPELALPDDELIRLLTTLADDHRHQVHIVSGRSIGFLERWLGHLPVHLHAEHGAARRTLGAKVWTRLAVELPWLHRARAVFEDFSRVTPGAYTETKEFGLCWHWPGSDPGAAASATELALHLSQVLNRTGADVLVGRRVVEVRCHGINKGHVAAAILREAKHGSAVVAAGDDSTDEDLFRALPADAVTIRVGPGHSAARYRVPDVASMRAFLARTVRAG